MKYEILKDKFLEAVSLVERISGKHVSLPVLSSILIEAKGDKIIIRATNLDIGIEETISAKIIEEGKVAVSGLLLKSFLVNIPHVKNVTCELVGDLFVVSGGQSEAKIKTVVSEEFPLIPKVEEGNEFIISTKELADGLKSVVWSSGVSSVKQELSSVYLYEDSDSLVFVATDSFRLAERKIKSKKTKSIEPILIPSKNVIEMLKIFETKDGEASIMASKNQISITIGDTYLSSRLVDGAFPDYKQIIPKDVIAKATVLRGDFLQALKLVSFFSDSFSQATFVFSVIDKKLTVTTKSDQHGESIQEIKCNIDGESATLTFNHRYILDALQMMTSESIELTLSGLGRPMVIRPISNESFLYLVMPMNR